MTDDIVTRLRVPAQHALVFGNIEQVNDERHEAADEIERLRQELADWKRTVRALEAELAEETSGYE